MAHASSEPPLQPFVPPEPWRVAHCTLRALEPGTLSADDPRWGWFTEDLLRVVHPSGRSIDVGWLPDGAPDGQFRLTVLQDDDWRMPVHTARHPGLAALLRAIETNCASEVAHGVRPFLMVRAPFPLLGCRFALIARGDNPVSNVALAADDADPGVVPTEADLLERIRGAQDPRDAVSGVLVLRDRSAVRALVVLLADPRERVRYAVVDALTALCDPDAGEALFSRFLLPEPDLATRRRLIDALGAVGHTPAVPVLTRWLHNPDAEQRIAAARALARIGAVEALDAVQEAYATERSHRVRPHLKEALQRLARA